MKTLWLVYERDNVERNRFFIERWKEAAEQANAAVRLVFHEDLAYGLRGGELYLSHAGKLPLPDAAVMRLNQPLLSAHLEGMGVPVFNNSKVASICNDKRATHQLVSGLWPAMDTVFLRGDEEEPPLPYPLVIKAAHSCGGRAVYLVRNREEFARAAAAIKPDAALAQAFTDTPGRDVRVYVLGRDIIAVLMRRSDTDFRSNIGQGGTAAPYELKSQELDAVNKIISLFDFGLVGIDFILHKGELLFNEIEDAVGTRMLFANGHLDIVKRYLGHILNTLEKN